MRNLARTLSLILIFTLPWEGVIRLPGLGTGSKILGFVVLAFWIATVIFTGKLRKPHLLHVIFYLFVMWNAVSIFWSADPRDSSAHVLTWLQLLIFAFILWDLFTTRPAILAGLQAYILGAYVAIGGAFANYIAGNAFYTHYQRFSPGDTNPDGFGFLIALGIPVAWYLASSKNTTKFLKLVNYLYVPLAFLGLALSGTRTALVASIVGNLFGLILLKRVRFWVKALVLLVLISAVLYLLPQIQSLRSFQRFGTIGTELASGDLNRRTLLWQEGLATFAEHPLLGVGSNMYRSVDSLDKVAHNSYISVLVELGLVGFVLFGAILVIVFSQAWVQPRWDSWFWLTVLLVWGIGSFTLTWEYRKTTWLFLSFVIASAALNGTREGVGLIRRAELEIAIPAILRNTRSVYLGAGILLVIGLSFFTVPLLSKPGVTSFGSSSVAGLDVGTQPSQPDPTVTPSVLGMIPVEQALTSQGSLVGTVGNCTFGAAHWRANYARWEVDVVRVGNLAFSSPEALRLLSQEPPEVTALLRQELVTYSLNVSNGAAPGRISDIALATTAWLEAHAGGESLSEAGRLRGLALAKALRDFNEGVTGPGACPEYTETPTSTPTSTKAPTRTDTPTSTATRRMAIQATWTPTAKSVGRGSNSDQDKSPQATSSPPTEAPTEPPSTTQPPPPPTELPPPAATDTDLPPVPTSAPTESLPTPAP